MNGALPSLSFYAFITSTVTRLPLPSPADVIDHRVFKKTFPFTVQKLISLLYLTTLL